MNPLVLRPVPRTFEGLQSDKCANMPHSLAVWSHLYIFNRPHHNVLFGLTRAERTAYKWIATKPYCSSPEAGWHGLCCIYCILRAMFEICLKCSWAVPAEAALNLVGFNDASLPIQGLLTMPILHSLGIVTSVWYALSHCSEFFRPLLKLVSSSTHRNP